MFVTPSVILTVNHSQYCRGLNDFAHTGMFGFFFAKGPITCFEEASSQVDLQKFRSFHRGMVCTTPPNISSYNLSSIISILCRAGMRLCNEVGASIHTRAAHEALRSSFHFHRRKYLQANASSTMKWNKELHN